MSKTVLNIIELNLLLNSEEPKNTELYGNLSEVLLKLENIRAVSLEHLPSLDEKATRALTLNKKSLIDMSVREWVATTNIVDRPCRDVKCELCNTKIRYLCYIFNRKNSTELRVGSECIKNFPNMEGYVEQRQQFKEIHKGHKVVARRNEFYDYFGNVEKYISDAENYFSTFPILLPYDLYIKLQDTINRMRLIYTKYVNNGTKPFKSEFSSFKLFELAEEQYKKLKILSDAHLSKYREYKLVCERPEIDWLINENKESLLRLISKNDGIYKKHTLQSICSKSFINKNINLFINRNRSNLFIFERIRENELLFSFVKVGYQPSLLFTVSFADFMKNIGANCIIDETYHYGSKEMVGISKILNTMQSLQTVINYLDNIVYKYNCALLVDEDTKSLILYRRGDKSIRTFSPKKFLGEYSNYFLFSDDTVKRYIFSIVKGNSNTKWFSKNEQLKQGINEKIARLYKEQYSDRHYANYGSQDNNIELSMYNTIANPKTGRTVHIDFNNLESVNIPRNKIKLSDNSLKYINYAIHINSNIFEPNYHKGDVLLVSSSQTIRNNNTIYYITSEGFFIKKCYTKEYNESIHLHIDVEKDELISYGRVSYCLYRQYK